MENGLFGVADTPSTPLTPPRRGARRAAGCLASCSMNVVLVRRPRAPDVDGGHLPVTAVSGAGAGRGRLAEAATGR